MPPRRAANVLDVVWRGTGSTRYGGTDARWQRQIAYDASEKHHFRTVLNKPPRTPQRTQLAQAGWPGVFPRAMPKKLPSAPSNELDAWYEWVSERCTLHIDNHSYDGKVVHVLVKPRPVFFVLISYRESPDAREWLHEMLRVPIQGTPQQPFADAAAAEWPGPPELQAPGQPWDVLYDLYPDGRELHTVDVWEKPLSEICVAVGPAPHIYLEATAIKQSQVWVQDDFGSVLVKDARRPKQHDSYQGDERGRYSRTWLSRDKVQALLRSSVGFTPGAVWRRRNALVLFTHWRAFRDVETWYKDERLFDYDLTDPEDLLKMHSFLLITPLADAWIATPSPAVFRNRCTRIEALAYNHLHTLPHTRGGAPAPQLAGGGDDDEEDSDDVAEEAVADEHDRANLSGFPQQCCLVWGKLDGVKGAIPADAVEVTHISPDGAAELVESVDDITFPEPNDGFHAVAQSSLLNSAQLTSLYSTTGTRCHLVMCFEAILKPGAREIDADGPLFIPATRAGSDKRSPYERSDGGVVSLKPTFHRFVFETFYVAFVRGALAKLNTHLGDLVLTEFPVFHPHLLIGRGAGALLKRPQTVLDSVYRSTADGKLTLVDLKTLMEARAPNYRLLNAKNLRQVIANALYFELMTKMRITRVALAYVSRSGSVTLVSVNIERCGAVLVAAALSPLKGGDGGGVRYLFNTATHVGVNKRIRIEAFDALGVDTSGEAVGQPLPSFIVLPKAEPPAPPTPPPPPAPIPRPRRKSPPPRRTASPSPPPTVGAPLDNLYVNPDLAAQAVVGAAASEEVAATAVGAATAATRADINNRIGEACERVFDSLPAPDKARLRGRADDLFQYLAHGALFQPERVADATVEAVETPAMNQPRHYAPEFVDEALRPEVLQVLIRTAQRALNAAVVHRFARTRSERADTEVADGVTTREFLESVLHHSRRDMWTEAAIEWADGRVDGVLALVRGELEAFLRSM